MIPITKMSYFHSKYLLISIVGWGKNKHTQNSGKIEDFEL